MARSDAPHLEGAESSAVRRDFDAFYRDSRQDLVRALVLAVGDRDLGVEATDEAFSRALEQWADVSGYANPPGWVFRVGLNWARSRLRRRSLPLERIFSDSVHLDDLPDPELLSAVEQLPLKYRSVVVSRFFLDWSIEQTAEALDIPEGTVKTRQARALSRLRRHIGEPNES